MISKKQITIIAQACILTSQLRTPDAYGMAARLARRTLPMARSAASKPAALRTTQALFATTRLLQTRPQALAMSTSKVGYQASRLFSTSQQTFANATDATLQNSALQKAQPFAELINTFGVEQITETTIARFKELAATDEGCTLLRQFYTTMEKKFEQFAAEQKEREKSTFKSLWHKATNGFKTEDAAKFPLINKTLVNLAYEYNFAHFLQHKAGEQFVNEFTRYNRHYKDSWHQDKDFINDTGWDNGSDRQEYEKTVELVQLFGTETLSDAAKKEFRKLTTTKPGCKALCLLYKNVVEFNNNGVKSYAHLPGIEHFIGKFNLINSHLQTLTLKQKNFDNLCEYERGAELLSHLQYYNAEHKPWAVRNLDITPVNLISLYSQLINEKNLTALCTPKKSMWSPDNGRSSFLSILVRGNKDALQTFLPFITAKRFVSMLDSHLESRIIACLTEDYPEAMIPRLRPFRHLFQDWVESKWTTKDGQPYNHILDDGIYMDHYDLPRIKSPRWEKLLQEEVWPGMYPDCMLTRNEKAAGFGKYGNRQRIFVRSGQETVTAEEKQRVNAAWKFEQFTPTTETLKALISQVNKSALEFCGYPKNAKEVSERRRTVLKQIHPDTHPTLGAAEKALLEELAKKANNAFDSAAKQYENK